MRIGDLLRVSNKVVLEEKTSSGWAGMRRFVGNNLEMVTVIILLVFGNFSVQGARLQPDGLLVEGTIGKQVSATYERCI